MITYEMISESLMQWSRSDSKLRYGQYFINHYMPSDTVWPELFYEVNHHMCITMLLQRLPVVELTIPQE